VPDTPSFLPYKKSRLKAVLLCTQAQGQAILELLHLCPDSVRK
jgi:hypothetical protein